MNINTALFSWRSIVGFLSFLGGVLSSITSTDPHVAPWLIGAGAVTMAAERVAQALETPTTGNVSAAVSASEQAAAKLLSDFQAFQKSQGVQA